VTVTNAISIGYIAVLQILNEKKTKKTKTKLSNIRSQTKYVGGSDIPLKRV